MPARLMQRKKVEGRRRIADATRIVKLQLHQTLMVHTLVIRLSGAVPRERVGRPE